ncbi:hypothetical protein J4E93_009020 [Alternaria ventricosa]|uniref:uncharacterized protein n=1 Tax=Alternaria ventricosa TaxID=1187951 RepID=UPI0020C50ED8|nr:uncharacterized protein J4E93_009020 [Alternaria ventricosa]KAI4639666.1 hypothetical protein J4E93_009020 [Alternaria ventricosa]
MVASRADALEKELCEERIAHTATKQEVINLRKHLTESEQKRRVLEGDMQLVVLKCKFLEGDGGDKDGGSCDGDMGAVVTEDEALRAALPDAPIHHPEIYKSRSSSHSEEDDVAASTHGTKRTFDETNSEEQRVIVCIDCYQHKLRCDPGEPCNNCANSNRVCKRAKCRDYETGQCKRVSCLRAHRQDEEWYENIVRAGHVPRTDPSKPIMPRKRPRSFRYRKDDDDKMGGDGGGGGGTGLALRY